MKSPSRRQQASTAESATQTKEKIRRKNVLKLQGRHDGALTSSEVITNIGRFVGPRHISILSEKIEGGDVEDRLSRLLVTDSKGERIAAVAKYCQHAIAIMRSRMQSDERRLKEVERDLLSARIIIELSDVSGTTLPNEILEQVRAILLTSKNMSCFRDKGRSWHIVLASLFLIKSLCSKDLITSSGAEYILTAMKSLLGRTPHADLVPQVINFLNCDIETPVFTQKLCCCSKDSCFLFFLCSATISIASSSSTSSMSLASLATSFCLFLSSHVPLPDLPWIGMAGPKNCRWCRSDVLRTLTGLTWWVAKRRFDMGWEANPELSSAFLQALRLCVSTLHQLWSTDPEFVKTLGESPGLQRQYIWTTRQLTLIKDELKLQDPEALSDLLVECEQGGNKMSE